jgi:hypothetical protein
MSASGFARGSAEHVSAILVAPTKPFAIGEVEQAFTIIREAASYTIAGSPAVIQKPARRALAELDALVKTGKAAIVGAVAVAAAWECRHNASTCGRGVNAARVTIPRGVE